MANKKRTISRLIPTISTLRKNMSTYYVSRDKIYTDTTKSYLLHRERELNQLIARITYSVKNGPEFHEYRIRYHSRLGTQLVICSVTVA